MTMTATTKQVRRVLVSPLGTPIIGTVEIVPACALIHDPRIVNGELEFEWTGQTECYWDGQETERRDGERVFQDDEGREFLESELRLVTEEEFAREEARL